MIGKVKDGWVEVEGEDFWAYYKNGVWAGLTIAKLSPYFGDPNRATRFHIRFYPQDGSGKDYDIADTPSLQVATSLV